MILSNHSFEGKPFKVHVFNEVLKDEAEVQQLRRQLAKCVKLKRKNNDLYRFAQSKDLRSELGPGKLSSRVNQFVEMLATKVRAKLQKETSIKLSQKHLDVTVSRYKKGDYLLCHNDHIKYGGASSKSAAASQSETGHRKLGHRRALAFVFYLTKRRWNVEQDGGALALYEADSMGEPVRVVRRIEPQPNTLVVFETSELSWHAVEEVFCHDDIRLSINGWFHTDTNHSSQQSYKLNTLESCATPLYRPIPLTSRVEKFFQECVNEEYLSNRTCTLIRRRFKKKSEINLVNFLVPEKYKQISQSLEELAEKHENLIQLGPYNKRHYHIFKLDTLNQLCRDLYEALRSEFFYMLLARLTGLDLQPPSLGDPGSPEEGSSDSGESSTDSDHSSSGQDERSTGDALENNSDIDVIGDEEQSPVFQEEEESRMLERTGKPTKRKKISDPLARFEFRHFQQGSYTLIHDHSFELAEKSALDVMLHFNHDFQVNFQDGGFISYIDGSGEENHGDDELLTIEPKSNCLSLVYREKGTCRFVKHINKSHQANYQDLSCVFYEKPDDLPRVAITCGD